MRSKAIQDILDNKDTNFPQEVINAAKKIDSIRRGLLYSAKQNIPGFSDSLDRVKKFNDADKANKPQLQPGDQLAYGLIDSVDFVTMATTDSLFRQDLEKLSNQPIKNGSKLSDL